MANNVVVQMSAYRARQQTRTEGEPRSDRAKRYADKGLLELLQQTHELPALVAAERATSRMLSVPMVDKLCERAFPRDKLYPDPEYSSDIVGYIEFLLLAYDGQPETYMRNMDWYITNHMVDGDIEWIKSAADSAFLLCSLETTGLDAWTPLAVRQQRSLYLTQLACFAERAYQRVFDRTHELEVVDLADYFEQVVDWFHMCAFQQHLRRSIQRVD